MRMQKISSSLAIALGLVAFTGCKKKAADTNNGSGSGSAMTTGSGSDTGSGSGSGSAMAGSGSGSGSGSAAMAPDVKPNPALVAQLGTQYQVCLGHINKAEWDKFASDCVDDNYTGHAIAGMPEVKGKDALVNMFKDQKAAFPDWKLATQLLIIDEANVFAVNLSTGTHNGPMKTPMGEIPATKKHTGTLVFHRLKFTDAAKASDEWLLVDPATIMGQLGLSPKEAPPVRPVMEKGGSLEMATTQFPADQANVKANLEVVKKINDAFNAHKTADVMALVADDAVESDQADSKDHKGKAEMEKGLNDFFAAFSDVKLANVETWAAMNYVVQIGKVEGTNDGDMGPMKKTGKKMSSDYAEIIKLEGGKVTKLWRFHNGLDAAMQLGMVPMPGGAGSGSGSAAHADGSAAGSGSAK